MRRIVNVADMSLDGLTNQMALGASTTPTTS